jgi:archaellum component FlaC
VNSDEALGYTEGTPGSGRAFFAGMLGDADFDEGEFTYHDCDRSPAVLRQFVDAGMALRDALNRREVRVLTASDLFQLSAMHAPWAVYLEADGHPADRRPITDIYLWECALHSLVIRRERETWAIEVAPSIGHLQSSDSSQAPTAQELSEPTSDDEHQRSEDGGIDTGSSIEEDRDERIDKDIQDLRDSIAALRKAMVDFDHDSASIRTALKEFVSAISSVTRDREHIAKCAIKVVAGAESLLQENQALREHAEAATRQWEDTRAILQMLALGRARADGTH